jgi:hypothetical protein
LPWWLPEICNALGNPKCAQRISSLAPTVQEDMKNNEDYIGKHRKKGK